MCNTTHGILTLHAPSIEWTTCVMASITSHTNLIIIVTWVTIPVTDYDICNRQKPAANRQRGKFLVNIFASLCIKGLVHIHLKILNYTVPLN